jgi:hypothetical protein
MGCLDKFAVTDSCNIGDDGEFAPNIFRQVGLDFTLSHVLLFLFSPYGICILISTLFMIDQCSVYLKA